MEGSSAKQHSESASASAHPSHVPGSSQASAKGKENLGKQKVVKNKGKTSEVSETTDVASRANKKRRPNASGTRKTSVAWDHFDKLPDNEVSEPTAACKYCSKRYLCDSKLNGTSSMLSHIKLCPKYPYSVTQDPKQRVLNVSKLGNEMSVADQMFNFEECRKALATFVIMDEQPFRVVEGEGFRYYSGKMQPLFILPSRFTVARDCYQLYLDEKIKLKALLKRECGRVCITTDCWTSIQNLNYLTVTAHFIDTNWKLNKRILCFSIVPNHRGETIGKYLDDCMKEWGIKAVFSVTVDNASSNDVAISYLKKRIRSLNANGLVLDGELLHVRCCAHILNLVVNDGLKDMHLSISNIRNAVRYVRSSPSRLGKFKECVDFASLPSKRLVCLDVPTRWNSTYLMLEAAIQFQAAFEKLEDDDSSYVDHFGENGPPSPSDWANARVFLKFLKIFYDATLALSGTLTITAAGAFHQLAIILVELNTWCNSKDDNLLKSMAVEMKKKYDKYWGNVNNVNPVLYLGVVFDPRYKLKYIEWSFERMYGEDMFIGHEMFVNVKIILSKLYSWYVMTYEQGKTPAQASSTQESQFGSEGHAKSGFLAAFRSHLKERNSIEQKNELEKYLAEGCEDGDESFDVLTWWKVNAARFPIMSRLARDVLATPISTVASESAFSTGGRVLDSFRSSLSPKMTEALICAQNWLKGTSTFRDRDIIEELEICEKIELEVGGLRQPQGQESQDHTHQTESETQLQDMSVD